MIEEPSPGAGSDDVSRGESEPTAPPEPAVADRERGPAQVSSDDVVPSVIAGLARRRAELLAQRMAVDPNRLEAMPRAFDIARLAGLAGSRSTIAGLIGQSDLRASLFQSTIRATAVKAALPSLLPAASLIKMQLGAGSAAAALRAARFPTPAISSVLARNQLLGAGSAAAALRAAQFPTPAISLVLARNQLLGASLSNLHRDTYRPLWPGVGANWLAAAGLSSTLWASKLSPAAFGLGSIGTFKSVLDGVLKQWRFLADYGTAAGGALARIALQAAMKARDAVVHGRLEEVDDFIRDWLEQQPLPWRREAVSDVLLSQDWIPAEPEGATQSASDLVRRIRFLARDRARDHKWLADTQINGRKIEMLDRPFFGPGGSGFTLLDSLSAAPEVGEFLDGFEDPRLNWVIDQLEPEEKRVVWAYAFAGVQNWPQAAAVVGLPVGYAERVRRKCQRLHAQYKQRRNAAAEAAARPRPSIPRARLSIES